MKAKVEGGASTQRSERIRRLMDALREADLGTAKQEVREGLREELGDGLAGEAADLAADVILPDSTADLASSAIPVVGQVKKVGQGAKKAAKVLQRLKMPEVQRAKALTDVARKQAEQERTSLIEKARNLADGKLSPEDKKRLVELQDILAGDTITYGK